MAKKFKDAFDVAVVGLGAMGSAATYHLAKRGLRVLGLDRFEPPHTLGSSHGESRIIREAYFEGPQYVPLVQRAYELWENLEAESGKKLYLKTGGLMIGPENSDLVQGALQSAKIHQLAHKVLTRQTLIKEYPVFKAASAAIAVWEPRAGVLYPELCVSAHLDLAKGHGASLRYNEPLCEWHINQGAKLITEKGIYRAERLIFSAGAWLTELLADTNLPLSVERQVLFWFESINNHNSLKPERFPIFIWEYEPEHLFYGFPNLGDGIKVAFHRHGELTSPDRVNRQVQPDEAAAIREVMERYLPDAAGKILKTAVCLYTNTPDTHFLVDRHPDYPEVIIASPCSGHGFKFSSAIGEVLADVTMGQKCRFDLDLFGLARFRPVDRAS